MLDALKIVKKFFPSVIIGFFFIFILSSPLIAEENVSPPTSDLRKSIEILENDQKRAEVLGLLKSIAEAEENPVEKYEVENSAAEAAVRLEAGFKAYLSTRFSNLWRDINALPSALKQAGQSIKDVFSALAKAEAYNIWRPYLLKVSFWGLLCLMSTWLIMRKYGHVSEECFSKNIGKSTKALIKYILIIALPNMVLILTLLAIPPPSPTLPGVTADMATGFSLVHSIAQHFFVNFSLLYISLSLATALLTPGEDGHSLIDLHPMIARHLRNSWRVFSVYVAGFVFIDATLLNSFAGGLLYSLCLVVMTLPVPIYFTMRILKLRQLVHAVSEAEDSAGDELSMDTSADPSAESPSVPQVKLDYRADLFFKKHWMPLLIGLIWLMTIAALFNPLGLAGQFGGRAAASMFLPILAWVIVKFFRRLLINLVNPQTEEGRRVLLNADSLLNIIIWLGVAFSITVIWGLPLQNLFENLVFQDIIGRAFAIFVILVCLVFFIRFSHLTTDWLLAVPAMENNRNWRTITPLVLTSFRALAVFVAVVVILERLGVNIGPILAGAGILGLGVGMGAQSLVKDVINGVSILLMDTLAVGDWVSVGGQSGTVMSVGIRSLRLRDSTGNLIVVPNSSVDTITNMTKDYSSDLIEFTTPYDADPDEMLKMATGVAKELSSDPAWKRYLTSPVNVMGVTAFDANGTTIRLKINTTAGDQWSVGRELRLRLKRRMMKEGINSNWFGQNLFLHQGNWGDGDTQVDGEARPDDNSNKEEK